MTATCARPILNQMVYYQKPNLDRTFAALADPTRRALLARLSEKEDLSVSELAKPFSMSLPAIMKHLDVLSDAGLVGREKNGRIVSCRLRAEPMRDANDWLNRYQKFWTERLDRLAAFLEEDTWPPSQPSPASPSSAGSTRRPEKVFAAWTDPEKVKHWMGPGEIKALRADSDPRTGGRYRWVMRSPDGEEHDVSGIYREVIPNEKLVFTWAWKSTPERESLVTLTFKRDGDGTHHDVTA